MATYLEHLDRIQLILSDVMAEVLEVSHLTIYSYTPLGRRYKRILTKTAERAGITLDLNSMTTRTTFSEALNHLTDLAVAQDQSQNPEVIERVRRDRAARRNRRRIERVVLQALSERCGRRVVDIPPTMKLEQWSNDVTRVSAKLLGVACPAGITPSSTVNGLVTALEAAPTGFIAESEPAPVRRRPTWSSLPINRGRLAESDW